MIKNRLDFKLINITLIAIICFFVYQSSGLWLGILEKILNIIVPLFAGFIIAYALYPTLEGLIKRKVPKGVAIFIIFGILIAIFASVVILIVPMLSQQIVSLVSSLGVFITEISASFNIDFGSMGETLNETFNQIIANVGEFVSDGAVKTINTSISVITSVIIALASSIYFLIDMDKIRENIKKILQQKSQKIYSYVATLDNEIKKYLKGFIQIVCISFFEYTIAYYLIGHPNALVLGFLAALGSFIPYFGGMLVQVVAIVTAFVISPTLCLWVIILAIILGIFDSYFLNPFIYGKSNQVHPIIVITAVFAGSILFGFIGIVIALPLSLIIIASIKFYKENYGKKELKIAKRNQK